MADTQRAVVVFLKFYIIQQRSKTEGRQSKVSPKLEDAVCTLLKTLQACVLS